MGTLAVRTFSFPRSQDREVNFIKRYKQYKQRPEELVNENIPNVDLLVIDENGNKLGTLSRREALNRAALAELDLVVVSPGSKPMVAKFMDYSKYRYEQQRREREMKKNQRVVELKEIRLSPTIDKHDLETKLRHARRFLEKGDKVKLSIRFFGRMITHINVGRTVMNDFIEQIGESGNVESMPTMDGRHLVAIIAPANNT